MGKSSGPVSFAFNTGAIRDRFQVWTDDDQLLYDSGCVSAGLTRTIDSNYPNNRVLVLTLTSTMVAARAGTGP